MAVGLRMMAVVSLLLASLYIVTSGVSAGTEWTVDDDWAGADFDNIQDALNASSDWDHIRIYEGQYFGNVHVNTSVSMIGNGTGETWLHSEEYRVDTIEINADDVAIKKMNITGGDHHWAYGVIGMRNVEKILIQGCIVDGTDSHGIKAENASWSEVRNCTIRTTGSGGGIHWSSSHNMTIDGNEITDSPENCIRIQDSNEVEITDNHIANSHLGIIIRSWPGPVNNVLITRNNITDHWGWCIQIGSEHNTNISIHHNEFREGEGNHSNLTQALCVSNSHDNVTWDDGGEGNYWDDYNGTDADEDGIGDTAYEIDGEANCTDRYPLMEPAGGGSENSAPSAHISGISPTPAYVDDNVTFSGYGEDSDGTIVRYRWASDVDGIFYNGTSNSTTYSNLSVGEHKIKFWVMDDDHAWSSYVHETLHVKENNTAPVASIYSISPNPANSSHNITFTSNASDSDGEVVWYYWHSSIDGELYEGNQSHFQKTGLSSGNHTIKHKVRDDDGATSDYAYDHLVINGTENSAPVCEIVSITPDPANETDTVTFTGAAEDEDGEVVWFFWYSSMNGVLYEGNVSSFSRTNLSKGNHTIKFKVRDDDGEYSAYDYAHLIVNGTDNQAPEAEIVSISPNPAEYGDNVTFNGSGYDSDGNVTAYDWYSTIDGWFHEDTESEFTTNELSPGDHVIKLKVWDDDGAHSEFDHMELTINGTGDENKPPEAEIVSISPNPADYGDNITFNGTGYDTDGNVTGYDWYSSIDGWFHETADNEFGYSGLSPGNHTIKLKAWDDDGAHSGFDEMALVVNRTDEWNEPPKADIVLISPNPANTNDTVHFNGSASDDDGEVVWYFWYSFIDGTLYEGNESSFHESGLSPGNHTIKFKVRDDDGAYSDYDHAHLLINASENETSKAVPRIGSISPGSADEGDYVTFNASGSEDAVKYHWRSSIDGLLYHGPHFVFSTKKMSNGTHTIYLKVRDEDGVWSEEVNGTVTINGAPSAVIVSISPDPALYGEDVTFTASGSDDGNVSKYLWTSSIDEELYEGTDATFTTDELSLGTHDIHLWTVDDEGGVSDPVVDQITVNRAPTVSITSHDTGDEVNGTIKLAGTAWDSNGIVRAVKMRIDNGSWKWVTGTVNWSHRVDTTELADGNHTVSVIAYDGYHHSDQEIVVLDVDNGGSDGKDGGADPLIRTPSSEEQGLIAGVAVAGALVAFAFTGIGYYLLLSLLFPLYTRLRTKRITDQRTRGKLVDYILENPGAHFSLIKKQLALPNGSAGYHLKVLENAGFIKSRSDGFRKRFYPYGYKVPEFQLKGAEVRIVELVGAHPGITQARLARKLKVTQPAISYHLKALRKKGVVVTSRGGGTRLTNDFLGIMNSDRVKGSPQVGKPGRAPARSKR